MLLESIETNKQEVLTEFTIDCLEINEELVKISPLLKTLITPQEIFTRKLTYLNLIFIHYMNA